MALTTAALVPLLSCSLGAGRGTLPPPSATSITIDREVRDIDRELDSYRKVERDVLGESAEGGMITGYADGAEFRRVDTQIYGEGGQAATRYYMTGEGDLIFVRRTVIRYRSPLTTSAPDVDSSVTSEYYLDRGVLIATETNGNPADLEQGVAATFSRELADHLARLRVAPKA